MFGIPERNDRKFKRWEIYAALSSRRHRVHHGLSALMTAEQRCSLHWTKRNFVLRRTELDRFASEHPRGSHGIALAMAKRPRGARHRFDSVRVPRSPDRDERSGSAPVLRDYVAGYMKSRTHLALGKDTPCPRPVTPPSTGRVVAIPEVGGLHHRYNRIAV